MNDPVRRMRLEARRLTREQARDDAGDGRAIARALRTASRRRPDRDTRLWFDRIESERRRLRASRRELSGGSGTTSTVGQVTQKASVPRHQAALLFNLVREIGARRCLEMGTCVGVSGAYLAAAMATLGGGELLSLEGHRDRAEVARETWRRLGLDGVEVVVGRFARSLPEALAAEPFDLVFVDGHHDGEATLDYVGRIRAASRPGAVLVLDDIDWSDGMRWAWASLRAQLTGSATSDLGRLGIIRLGPADAGRG
jgi:predicted O-methyltransferase YrrM